MPVPQWPNLPDALVAVKKNEGEFSADVLEPIIGKARLAPGGDPPGDALAIAGGVLTPTRSLHFVDTETQAATDDLTNITPGDYPEGAILTLLPAAAGRDVTYKHAAGGQGQLILLDGVDITVRQAWQALQVRFDGTDWQEVPQGWRAGREVILDVREVSTPVSAVNFTGFSTAFDSYLFRLSGVTVDFDGTFLGARLALDGGGLITTALYRSTRLELDAGVATPTVENNVDTNTWIRLASDLWSAGFDNLGGTIHLHNRNMLGAARNHLTWEIASVSGNNNRPRLYRGNGFVNTAGLMTQIQIFASGANLTAGRFEMVGLRKV